MNATWRVHLSYVVRAHLHLFAAYDNKCDVQQMLHPMWRLCCKTTDSQHFCQTQMLHSLVILIHCNINVTKYNVITFLNVLPTVLHSKYSKTEYKLI